MRRKQMLNVFRFGYWGWGRDPSRLVQMVEGFEAEAGFDPPLWVDIRHSRNVRAPGFNGNTFGEMRGQDRYVW